MAGRPEPDSNPSQYHIRYYLHAPIFAPTHLTSSASVATPIVYSFPNNSKTALPAICSDPQPDDCSFYPLCLESRYHCGPCGYPLHYGLEGCQAFWEQRDKLSPEGQDWMLKTVLCLQRKLVPYAAVDGGPQEFIGTTTCDALKEYALSTHPGCYIESGVCTLPPSDWVAIVDIIGIEAFGDLDVLKAALETMEGCLEFDF
ncbi:hypothetical protein VTN00DRAFT_4050 [Thermoascus crustaceus]|uniref:uncharacterized protein n=1 Tax=Thermoascus crustaceus TaxID=5088 RepID=UPI0037425B23